MIQKIDSYLGFARKAGDLVAGTGTCTILAKQKQLKLLIITEDMAASGREKMERMAKNAKIPYRIYGDSEHIGNVTGRPGRTVFGVTERGFAEVILKEIDRELAQQEEVQV